jgi:L-lactate dehydrogenase complex protein LldG
LREKNIKNLLIWEEYLQELAKFAQIDFQNNDENFENCEASITLCEGLIARTGSILVSSQQSAGRRLTIFPPIHIVIAFTSQCVWEVKDGLSFLKAKYQNNFPSMVSVISGPSQTADIEKTLVLGAHGPKELILLLVAE